LHNESLYAEKEWLVYEFQLPQELRLESKDMYLPVRDSRYAKMHIFMVNGRNVTKFFKCLTEAMENRSDRSGRALKSEFLDFHKSRKNQTGTVHYVQKHEYDVSVCSELLARADSFAAVTRILSELFCSAWSNICFPFFGILHVRKFKIRLNNRCAGVRLNFEGFPRSACRLSFV